MLAAYMVYKNEKESLADYLDEKVFKGEKGSVLEPNEEDVKGFDAYIKRYQAAIKIQNVAIETLGN